MIRIRSMHASILPGEQARIAQVQRIFRHNFPETADYADKIPDMLNRPLAFGYRAILLVAETRLGKVRGFCLCLYFPESGSALLDFLAVDKGQRGGGIGSALYESTRDYLREMGARGLFLEVAPDDPQRVRDPAVLADNQRRLKFYEHYGVFPVIGTEFELPIDSDPAPCLLFDGLGRPDALGRAEARAAVRVFLARKYADVVTPGYIERVVESFIDDPVRFRSPKYVPQTRQHSDVCARFPVRELSYVLGPRHTIHHVKDRGYVERPARVQALAEEISRTGMFAQVEPRRFSESWIRAVHDADFVDYLRLVCQNVPETHPVYPYVFPIRRPERRPRDLAMRAGYYCIDTFTPLDRNAYDAARGAVDVALTAAEELLNGTRCVYALCRPPGHHAGRRTFGGFCYFNNAAIAAHWLSRHGTVAIIDVDFHHGNGQQDIFYRRSDVLTVSLHGHPNIAYPYFSGFADEKGEGPGLGFNLNVPLPEATDQVAYLGAVDQALKAIRRFDPRFVVLCLGFDTLTGDPTGSFQLTPSMLARLGERMVGLDKPVLVVQEGGYSLRNLRRGVRALFGAIAEKVGEIGGLNPGHCPVGTHKNLPGGDHR